MRVSLALRTVLVCLGLQVGVMFGVPMRPEQVEELMRELNQPRLAHELRGTSDAGDD